MSVWSRIKRLLGMSEPPRKVPPPLPPFQLPVQYSTYVPPTQPVQQVTYSPAGPQPAAPISPTVKKTKSSQNLNLDLGQFAPIADSDLKAAGSKLVNSWSNLLRFGRRGQIPPTADPRTLLIDRAMVGQGIITPEELANIHRLGDQMTQLRPDMLSAAQHAEQAVIRSQEERKRIREEKRAAAAEREQIKRDGVTQRRRTDIIYLGRGVSGQLNDRRSNVEKLVAASLPVLSMPADLAGVLGLTIPRLRWLTFHSEAATVSHYVRFTVSKKSGGTRQLAAPHASIAAAQQWVLQNVLAKLPTHDAAHGFVPGRSTVSNASPHVGKGLVVNADLTNFFPTITFPRVRGAFKRLGYSPAVASILALLCTEAPRREVIYAGRKLHVAAGPRALPQGACTSPTLSNLIARRLDARLAGISRKLGWTYTRYADDLTFSAGAEMADKTGYLLARLRHITQDEGFAVNEKKTRVQRPSRAQTVTGIVVNQRVGVPRKDVRRLRAILHRAKTQGLAAQNHSGHPNFEGWVRGMVAYVSMVNAAQAKSLIEALAALQG